MRLYDNPLSGNSRRARIAALLLGTELDLVNVDLPKGEQRLPPHLQRNPNGRVPVLDDGRFLLWESRAIMQYLAHKTPAQTLYRQDPRPDPAEIKRGEGLVAQFFPVLEGQLAGGKTWVTQDHMTLADVSLATTLALVGPAGIDLGPYPNMRAWHGRIRELEAWKSTEPPARS
jgi:glutathione S-transferase